MTDNNKSSEGICVAIRMRPLNDRETNSGQEKIFKCLNNCNAVQQVKDNLPVEGQTYYYDKVFDETSNTANVYSHIGLDIVQGVMSGINGTIFAYGQTSSGKTHTMLGGGDQKGVLYMAAEDIFNYIAEHPTRDFLLRASFVEIYNENIRDLLSESADSTVAIREDPRKGVYCEAVEFVITDFDSIIRLLKKGIAKRAVEATAMNDTSSRSHTIFKLVIESRESNRGGNDTDGAVLVAALNLVDLAGSESVKHTGAMGQRAKEGGKINQSLLSLSRVIHALSQPGVHVNFRDSKLTRLLQPSLCGNAKMSIVCCITSADRYLEETRSTLQFASRAKLVVTHATVNEVVDEAAQIRRLKKELDELKEKHRSSSDGSRTSDSFEKDKTELVERINQLIVEKEAQDAKIEMFRKYVNFDQVASEPTSFIREETSFESTTSKKRRGRPAKRQRQTIASNTLPEDENDEMISKDQLLDMHAELNKPNSLLQVMEDKENVNRNLLSEMDALKQKLSMMEETHASQVQDLETQLQHAQDEVLNLKIELDDANQTLHLGREFELMEEKSALVAELKAAKEAMETLSSSHEDLKVELSETKVTLGATELALKEASEMIEQQMQIVDAKEEALNTQQELMAKLQSEKEDAQRKYQDLQDSVNLKDDTINSMTLDMEALKSQLETSTQQIESLQAEVMTKDHDIENISRLETMVEKERELRADLQQSFDESQVVLAEKDEEIDALKTSIHEKEEVVAALEMKIQEVETKVNQQADTRTNMEEAMDALKEEMQLMSEEKDMIEQSKQDLTEQLSILDIEFRSVTQQKESLELIILEKDQAITDLKTSLEQVTNEVQIISEEKSTLQNELAVQQASFDEQKLAFEELIIVKGEEYMEVMKTCEGLRVEVARFAEDRESFQQNDSQMEEIMMEKMNLEAQLTALKEALNSALEDVMGYTDKISAYENLEVTLNTKIAADEAAIRDALADKMALNAALIAAQNDRERLEHEVVNAKNQLTEVKTELSNVWNENIRLSSASVQQELINESEDNELQEKIDELEAENKSLISDKASLEQQMEQMQTQFAEAAQVAVDRVQSEVQEAILGLEEKVHVLETDLENVSEAKKIVENEKASLQSRLTVVTEELQHVETESISRQETIAQLNADLASMEDKINTLEQEKSTLQAQLSVAMANNNSVSTANTAVSSFGRLNEIELTNEAIDSARKDLQVQVGSWQVSLGQREAELSKAWQERDELAVRLKAAEESLHSFTSTAMQLDSSDQMIRKRLQQLSTENDLLKGEKDNFACKIKSMEQEHKSQLDKAIQFGESMEQKVNQINSKCETLSREVESVPRLYDSIKSLEARVTELRTEREEYKKNGESLQQDLQLLQEQYDILYDEVIKLRSSQDDLREVNTLRAKMTSLETDKNRAEEESGEAIRKLTKCKEDIVMLQKDCESFAAKYDEIVAEKQAQATELEEALEKIEQLTVALEEADSMTEDHGVVLSLQAELDSVRQSESVQRLRISQLETSLEEAQDNIQKVEEELLYFQSECESYKMNLGKADESIVAQNQVLIEEKRILEEDKQSLEMTIETMKEEAQLKSEEAEVTIEKLKLKLDDLVSEKTVVEETVQTISLEKEELLKKLQDYDRNASEEQAMLMEAAEIQMEALRQQVLAAEARYGPLQAQVITYEEDAKKMIIQIDKLQQQLSSSSTISSDVVVAKDEEIRSLSSAKLSLESRLTALTSDLDESLEKIYAYEDKIVELEDAAKLKKHELDEMRNLLEVKEARIAHLDACKLTKDQMEKIKVIKEERKKFQEDAKTLKKQLVQLKQAYDDLKTTATNAATSSGNPSQEFVISDLKFQVAELTNKVSQQQGIVDLLKVKLKECSSQLEEYEQERSAVLTILEQHGVDVTALLQLETSLESDASSTANAVNATSSQDLADAVGKLGEKIISLQSMLSVRDNSKSSQVKDLEEKLRGSSNESEDLKATKLALEKRIESLKVAARTSREETAALTVELDSMREKVSTLQEELTTMEKKVVNSSDVVSSEVQALEEENIELLEENKMLRIELSRFKAGNPMHTVAHHPENTLPEAASTCSTPSVPAPTSAMKKKRAFGTEIDTNAASVDKIATSTSAIVKTASALKRPLVDIDPTDPENNLNASAGGNPKNGRRIRARAVVAGESQGDGKQECNQS